MPDWDEPFNWNEYYYIAVYLCTQCEDIVNSSVEARRRCGISRAYYAAYHQAKIYASSRENLRSRFGSENCYNEHRAVIEFFKTNHRVDIATKLAELRDWRNHCDYDPDRLPDPHMHTSAISSASSLIRQLEGDVS